MLPEVDLLYVIGRQNASFDKWLEDNPRRQIVFLGRDLFAAQPLDHPRAHMRILASPHDLILEGCVAEFPAETVEVLGGGRRLREKILRKNTVWHALIRESLTTHLFHRNVIPNLRRLSGAFYVNRWRGALKNIPAVICGAGPSLEKVALSKRHGILIGCGSALAALSHKNVRPHFGIAVDPNPREYDHLKGCRYHDLPLLFCSRVYPKVFEIFRGKIGYIGAGTGGRLETFIEQQLGLTEPLIGTDLGKEALSVTTLAVSLAHALGCNPIILAGVDLAYGPHGHYAAGVAAAGALETVIRRQGKVTHLKWIMERDVLDLYAKNHPETTFYTTSKRGLPFKHIRYLEKIPAENREYEFEPVGPTIAQSPDFAEVAASVERSLKLVQLLQQEAGGKAVLYEYDLAEELAYDLFLKTALFAYEKTGSTDKWAYLEEVLLVILESLR